MNLSDILIILALIIAAVGAAAHLRRKKGCSCGSCDSCGKACNCKESKK